MVEGVLSFLDSVLLGSRPPAGEEATALRPTTDQPITPSVSTEAAARPAGQAASEEASEEASGETSGETSEEASGEASEEATDDKKAWLRPTTDELATLLAAGLEPREGVPGLYLCRKENGYPILPPDPIKLTSRAQQVADAMRDELTAHLMEKGTKGLPTTETRSGEEGADLMGAWLQGADLGKAQLKGANLRGAQLQKAILRGAKLQKANLGEAKLEGAELPSVKLQGAELPAELLATLRPAGLEPREGVPGLFLRRGKGGYPIAPPDVKLERQAHELATAMRDELTAHLMKKGTKGLPTTETRPGEEGADLMGAWLQGANLDGKARAIAQLQGANFRGAQLQKAILRGVVLEKANLQKAKLQGADLSRAKLKGADLSEAQLQEAKLVKAQLQGAKLYKAQLRGANLFKVRLHQANLTRANLAGADLASSKLAGADFNSADLSKAILNEALESMRNYRPPHPPAALASSSWRSKSVAKSTALACYKRLAQDDDDDDDDGDDGDSSGSEDDAGGEAKVAPWLEAAEEVAAQAAGALIAVAQPVLEVVTSTVAELGRLCDALAERVPEALVQSLLPLLKKRPTLPAAQLQKVVVVRLKGLLTTCVLDSIFNKALPGAIRALKEQIEQLKLWMNGEKTLVMARATVELLQNELCTLMAELCKQQLELVEQFAKDFPPLVSARAEATKTPVSANEKHETDQVSAPAPAAVSSTPVEVDTTDQMQTLGKVKGESDDDDDDDNGDNSAPEDDGDDGGEAEVAPRLEAAEDVAAQAAGALVAVAQPNEELRDLAGEIIGALVTMLADDLEKVMLPGLKLQAQVKLDAFAKRAAVPISDMLAAAAKNPKAAQLAKQLPEVRGFIDTLKKEICEDALRKRITKGLMGAADTPLQRLGHGAEHTLALVGRFEQHLEKKLSKVNEAGQKLLRRQLPQGSLRARAFDVVLKTATKYEVRVDGFEGSFDMLKMAWKRSRVELNTDENQLVYLSEELKKLKDKESTAANWRDAAEGWISVLELRGQLRVECGQSVLECMATDEKVLEALGAAKALMHIEGDTPPAALVAIIAQGPGAHIRKHGYRYTRRLDKELVLIRRVKELQMRTIAGVGTLLVATSVTVGNYLARVMYDGVTTGFGSQPWLTWVVPLFVVVGLLVFCCFGLAAYFFCYKKKSYGRRAFRACIAPCA